MKDKIIKILNNLLNRYHAGYMISQDGEGDDILVEEFASRIDSLYSEVIEYGKADPDKWMEHKNGSGPIKPIMSQCTYYGFCAMKNQQPEISEGEIIEDVLKRLTKKNGLINTILELLQQNGIDTTQALSKGAKPISDYMINRKIIRDFIAWQLQEGMVNELTIDYEVAETYLKELNKKNT